MLRRCVSGSSSTMRCGPASSRMTRKGRPLRSVSMRSRSSAGDAACAPSGEAEPSGIQISVQPTLGCDISHLGWRHDTPEGLGSRPFQAEAVDMTSATLSPLAVHQLTDHDLVERLRDGDDDAFTTLVERHEPALRTYARGVLGGSHHDAEECVQDAFIRALD